MTRIDLQFIILTFVLGALFVGGLRKHPIKPIGGGNLLSVDLNMSNAMKGIACVMILMSHWGQRRFTPEMPWGVSKLVWVLYANIALTWFMFFSGYGLSLKNYDNGTKLVSVWRKRISKVYIPLLLCTTTAAILYALLPDSFSIEEAKDLWIPSDIHLIHSLTAEGAWTVILHVLGVNDWYVLCIIIFYTMFYISIFISRKTGCNYTLVLFGLMTLYHPVAFLLWGFPEGHFWRFTWVFMLGHVTARWHEFKGKMVRPIFLASFIMVMTCLIQSKMMIAAFMIAFLLIIIVSWIGQQYEMRGRTILLLGSVSFFFYLTHVRIGYPAIVYLDINSPIIWALIVFFVSLGLRKLYVRYF